MASLKEIKQRINSVQGTRKVTSAMKMVSSAKLHKAQGLINNMLPYQSSLDMILANFLDGEIKIDSPFVENNNSNRVAIVVFSSNSSLCGAFNYNIIKALVSTVLETKGKQNGLSDSVIDIYPIGKKVEEAVIKMGFNIAKIPDYKDGDYQKIAAKPQFVSIDKITQHLFTQYVQGNIGKVVVLYHHFKSPGVQIVTKDTLLPIDLNELKEKYKNFPQKEIDPNQVPNGGRGEYLHNYIVEPTINEVVSQLIPKVISQKLFTALADSFASEHAARTVAMQVATDNAEDLISELTILYNKSRQQAITAELLDILGGSIK